MRHRATIYAQRIRAELIEKLGGFCVLCGEDNPDELEFDHVHGRDYEPRKLSYSARMARYRREAAQGLLRLLCKACNLAVRKRNDNGQCVPTAFDVPLTQDIPF